MNKDTERQACREWVTEGTAVEGQEEKKKREASSPDLNLGPVPHGTTINRDEEQTPGNSAATPNTMPDWGQIKMQMQHFHFSRFHLRDKRRTSVSFIRCRRVRMHRSACVCLCTNVHICLSSLKWEGTGGRVEVRLYKQIRFSIVLSELHFNRRRRRRRLPSCPRQAGLDSLRPNEISRADRRTFKTL